MPIITAGNEQFHLSHEEEDKLNQFQTITNFSDDELASVIKLLQNHSWNLEAAISKFYDADWKTSLAGEQATPTPPPYNESNYINTRPRPPAPGPRPGPEQRVLVQPQFGYEGMVLTPSLPIVKRLPMDYREKFKLVGLNSTRKNSETNPALILLMLIPNALFKLISFLWSLLTSVFSSGNRNNNSKRDIFRVPKLPVVDRDPIDLSAVFLGKGSNEKGDGSEVASFEAVKSLLGDGPRLEFNEALRVCQEEFKFLLLILVGKVNNTKRASDGHKDDNDNDNNNNNSDDDDDNDLDINSRKFLTHVLGDSGTLNILNDYRENLVVYLGSVLEVEPWLVAKDMKVRYTPECFLIGNVLNSNGSTPQGVTRLSVLAKLRVGSARKFQNSLKMTIERFNPEMVVSRAEKEELRVSREIRQLQEQAYEDSLRKDMMKENKRRLERQEEELRTKIKLQKEQEKKLKSTLWNLKWLKLCLEYINTESAERKSPEPSSSYATLQIRTSGGKRMVKKFPGDTTLYTIYADIGCHLYLKTPSLDVSEWTGKVIEKMGQLANDDSVLCFKDKFELNTGEADSGNLFRIIGNELEKWEESAQEYDIVEPEISFNFELISPYPRYKIPSDTFVAIKEVPQLWPNGSLMVEHIEEEAEDE